MTTAEPTTTEASSDVPTPAEYARSLDARANSARTCRNARADLMAKSCTREEECASPAVAKACPGVPMTFACERGYCRSHRTDGCDPPYVLDADEMRRVIVNCVPTP